MGLFSVQIANCWLHDWALEPSFIATCCHAHPAHIGRRLATLSTTPGSAPVIIVHLASSLWKNSSWSKNLLRFPLLEVSGLFFLSLLCAILCTQVTAERCTRDRGFPRHLGRRTASATRRKSSPHHTQILISRKHLYDLWPGAAETVLRRSWLQSTETRLWTTLLSSALVPVRGALWDTIHCWSRINAHHSWRKHITEKTAIVWLW